MTIGNGDSAKEMLTAGAVSHPAMSGKRWRANSSLVLPAECTYSERARFARFDTGAHPKQPQPSFG